MNVGGISDLQALAALGLLIAMLYSLSRLIPAADSSTEERVEFDEAAITAYDRQLPKYLIASSIALLIAAWHAAIKSLPPVYRWLDDGDFGGHLVRDIANTHLMIVVGGTVAVTGLTWYVLPRVAQRPLWSERLATTSYWCTLLGAGGFYLVNVVAGLALAQMSHSGEADPSVGLWRSLPLGLSATVMGVGYWTFVTDVVMTVYASREVRTPRRHGHLAKFFAVGALGLFIGTVQGVIQVMPDQERWLHAAGSAGEYIDPISHAHVNLVTGTLVLVLGLAFFWSTPGGPSARERRREELVFWTLVPGSLAMYLTFLFLGFHEGQMVVSDGLSFNDAVARTGAAHTVPLALSGSATLIGLWLGLGLVFRRFVARRELPGARFIIAGVLFLVIGTAQGLVQLTPWGKSWIEAAGEYGDALANAHAQLNMLGGVILALLGLALIGGRAVLGVGATERLSRGVLRWFGAGVATYYVSAMGVAILAGEETRRLEFGHHDLIVFFGPLGMAVGAGLYGVGAGRFAIRLWRETATYRRDGWRSFMAIVQSYDAGRSRTLEQVPSRFFVAAEALGALAGFPGIGWLLSGRGLIGLPLALAGGPMAWAVVPLLTSPYSDGVLSQLAIPVTLGYLGGTMLLSSGVLALTLWRGRAVARKPLAVERRPRAQPLV